MLLFVTKGVVSSVTGLGDTLQNVKLVVPLVLLKCKQLRNNFDHLCTQRNKKEIIVDMFFGKFRDDVI